MGPYSSVLMPGTVTQGGNSEEGRRNVESFFWGDGADSVVYWVILGDCWLIFYWDFLGGVLMFSWEAFTGSLDDQFGGSFPPKDR